MTCSSGKVGYRSKRRALRAAETVRLRLSMPIKYAYLCGECEQWHLTSTPRRPEPKRRPAPAPPNCSVPLLAKPAPRQPWEVR